MISIVDNTNRIINIVASDAPRAENERAWYPWHRLWDTYTDEMPLEYAKEERIAELKAERDSAEVQPIEYNGKLYDYDDKARERINAAIIALDGTELTLSWTTADNTEAIVNAEDLKAIVRAVAVRSNELHVKYREEKEAVEEATTTAEAMAIGVD